MSPNLINNMGNIGAMIFGKLDNFLTGKYKLKCFYNNLNKNLIHIKHKNKNNAQN